MAAENAAVDGINAQIETLKTGIVESSKRFEANMEKFPQCADVGSSFHKLIQSFASMPTVPHELPSPEIVARVYADMFKTLSGVMSNALDAYEGWATSATILSFERDLKVINTTPAAKKKKSRARKIVIKKEDAEK
jgi:hypothetical protein